MRIILISIFSLVVVATLLTMARIWGLGQSFPVFEHAFFSGTPPLMIVKVASVPEAEEVLKLKSDSVLWIDVRLSREKTAFVLPPARDRELLDFKNAEQMKNPDKPILIGGRLPEYPFADIQEHFKNISTLTEFYQKFPQTRFVLNMVDNVSEAHVVVINAIKDFKPNERTLIQSDALLLMTVVKESKPEWVYGTSTPDLMRLMTFDSLFITPSIVFKGDVFIAPFKIMKRPAFNDDIIAEMRRRHKRLFLGPIHDEKELAEASRLKAEGYITENLPELLRLLGQGPAQ